MDPQTHPVPTETARPQQPATGDRYTCQTETGPRHVTVTRVCTPPDGGPVAIEFEWRSGQRTYGNALRLDVFLGTYARVCNAPGPDGHSCDLRADHGGQHEELGYGRLHTWPAGEPAAVQSPDAPVTGDADALAEHEQDRQEAERAHAAGDHQWCGVTCEIEFPSDVMRNTILCRAIPGSKSMLAELERRAAQPLAPVVEPPAGDTLPEWLCSRYRRYAFPFDNRTWEQLPGEDRSYWEHEAAAVRRAVQRGGFKAQAGGEQA